MPSSIGTVGPLQLPLPPGAANSAVDDPTLAGLAAFLAFWLNYDLNAKLASLNTGRSDDGSPVITAVPVGNVFLWNPTKPTAFFTRGAGDGAAHPLPALYVWDDKDKRAPFGQVRGMRERTVMAAWIFEEALLPAWHVDRHGLRAAACATLFRAIEQGWHEAYTTREHIAVQLGLAGHGIVYQGSERTMLSPLYDQVQGSDQPAIRAYPVALASYQVFESEDGKTATPADATPDLQVRTGVNESGDIVNALPLGLRVLPPPPYETST
jgi:hypothetical protein